MRAVGWCWRCGGAGGVMVRAVGWCGGGVVRAVGWWDGGVVRAVGWCGRWGGADGGWCGRWVVRAVGGGMVRVVMCWWVHDTLMSYDLTFVILELEL